MKYHIWTMGCQMNKAESSGLDHLLASLGFESIKEIKNADLVILNTCVVRQNAEDKVNGMLGFLKGIKQNSPGMRIVVTGCFVSDDARALTRSFPHVNHFFKPGEIHSFEDWLLSESVTSGPRKEIERSKLSTFIPIVQGCNNFCSYCIVPYRRGRERSRALDEIVSEASKVVGNGAREIILLGQNVNSYGKDLNNGADLSILLTRLNEIEGLYRIRFLTNHPKDMSVELVEAAARLDKVCHHFCVPLQAGDDRILETMNRHYTYDHYRLLVSRIRGKLPDVALSTDVIVGFPGESEEQFAHTLNAVLELRFDAVHIATYSVRSQTYASEHYPDDVPYETKLERLRRLEELQKGILTNINAGLVSSRQEILVEGKKADKWFGRTYSDKIVFFAADQDYTGQMLSVEILSASPWSLQGKPVRGL